jgi:dTMP kinase
MGRLIVLEGTDGAGKSTQLELIKKHLKNKKLTYDYLHFPMYGHNEFSEVIAKFLRGEFGGVDDVNPFFVANIYAMDRFLFLPELSQKLKENDVVLLDRYVFSNMAFQAGKFDRENDPRSWDSIIGWIDKFEFEFLELPYPDLTIFFDVPMEVVKERLSQERKGKDRDYLKGKQDIHEADLEFQKRVRDTYLALSAEEDYEDYYIVPCAELLMDNSWDVFSPDKLFNSYVQLINEVL